ncbi:RHS repeat-associated core domain-containing protein, partial [Ectothiorhodospira lacustris]|uniref:RHS repeat-associated core domain-containing protein n=1 Tax=Ectothiorhodospira lacustris TaxID=2899127 RepID=UPI001EE86B37
MATGKLLKAWGPAVTAAATTCPSAAAPVAVTDYAYDDLDRLIRVTENLPAGEGGNRITETAYNADDSVHSVNRAVGTALAQTYATYTYSTNGLPVTLTDAKGNRTTYEYDGHDRQVRLSYPHLSTANTSSTTDYEHYTYDAAGNRTRLTWPETAFYVTTTYDAMNRPTAIKELGTTNLATYAYDDLSRRTTVSLSNGTTTSYGYSPQGTLASLAHNLTGSAQDLTYSYTRNQVQEIVGQSWTNNLYQWAGYANGTKNYTSNRLNQYTTAAGATITHDAQGNLTGDGIWTYTFDTDNKLKTANRSGYSATLAYDAEGRLRRTVLAGTTTDLAYDGVDLVAEYNSTGALLRRYVHGPGIDEPLVWYEGTTTTNKRWLYADHLGSIVGQANAAGNSMAIYSYGPYGEPNVTTGVRFRYTGQQYLGGLNLYYYKARFYSPALGRFLQTDPIGTRDDLNLYAYVGNDPINGRDPSGLWVETAWDVANIGIGAASLAGNVSSGNWGWAALDTVGLVYDTAATAVPFLPAGASAGLKSLRAGNSLRTSVNIGTDTIATANVAHKVTSTAPTVSSAARQGTLYHDAVGQALTQSGSLSSQAHNAFTGVGRARGGPDVSWNGSGMWLDLTTQGSWSKHVRQYGALY